MRKRENVLDSEKRERKKKRMFDENIVDKTQSNLQPELRARYN